MCTRIEAIQVIITKQFGRKQDLINLISFRQYREFVASGLIREPMRMPARLKSLRKGRYTREWVATPLAFERAKMLNIKSSVGHSLLRRQSNTTDELKIKLK